MLCSKKLLGLDGLSHTMENEAELNGHTPSKFLPLSSLLRLTKSRDIESDPRKMHIRAVQSGLQ
jgi:hypothetical protein